MSQSIVGEEAEFWRHSFINCELFMKVWFFNLLALAFLTLLLPFSLEGGLWNVHTQRVKPSVALGTLDIFFFVIRHTAGTVDCHCSSHGAIVVRMGPT